MRDILTPDSTNVHFLVGLENTEDAVYLDGDGVVVTLLEILDQSGTPVTGATNLNMPKVDGTAGADVRYRCITPDTVIFQLGQTYTRRIRAVDALGNKRTWSTPVPCRTE